MNYYEPITEVNFINQREDYNLQLCKIHENRRKKSQDNKHKKALKETILSTIKKDIHTFPLEQCSKKDYASWVFPQILAHFANKKLFYKDFKVSPSLTMKNWNLDPLECSWLEYITTSPRSIFCASSKNPRYSQSVPLVLSAFKTYQDVNYETWDFSDDNIKFFLEPLHRDLLPLRTHNLPDPKTLDWNRLSKKLDSYCSFGEWEKEILGKLPRMAKYVYTQTWIWHPSKLHSLAIASLKNWDVAEKPLHQSNIFVTV